MKIINPTDPIIVDKTAILLYGGPGQGKTTIGCSAGSAILLDFDEGSHRALTRECPVAKVEQWNDIASPETFVNFNTIVVDTVGKMLDCLAAEIINKNPKSGRNGSLTLQGWGELGSMFRMWVTNIRAAGKDVVFLCHAKESQDDSGITAIRPLMQGQSQSFVLQMCDAVALVEHGSLFFGNRPGATTKGRLGKVAIPNGEKEIAGFCDKLLQRVKDSLSQKAAQVKESTDKLEQVLKDIEAEDNVDALRDKYAKLATADMEAGVKRTVSKAITERGNRLKEANRLKGESDDS